MYAKQTISSATPVSSMQAFDVEITPADAEYQEICDCVKGLRGQVIKVIRHQIPAAMYNGGEGQRVSWSVLARQAGGETRHYTVLNREASRCSEREMPEVLQTLHGYFLRSSRPCTAQA